MKKKVTTACALACAFFLCACAIGQDGNADQDSSEQEGETGISADGQTDAALPEISAADGQAGYAQQEVPEAGGVQADSTQQEAASGGGQDTAAAVPMQGLMQGNMGGIGSGLLAYTLPQQDGEDYQICFFKEGSTASVFEESLADTEYYPLEMADYIFPDVRENNASIGKFKEIYYFDTITIGGDGASGMAVVAAYDVDGAVCYDTRVYRWDGTDYSAERQLMQEANGKYSRTEEYPVEELLRLASGQEMLQQPEETTADDSYYSAATDLPRSEVEGYSARIRQLFLAHDWSAISSEISYPITISGTTYYNSGEFLDASGSFDGKLKEDFFSVLEEEKCTEMFCNWEGIMLGETGQIWIGEILDAEFHSQGLKIIAINGLL